MTIKGFIDIINSKLTGDPMQVIPSHSGHKMPPFPFATYDILDEGNEDHIKLDGREETPDGKLSEKASFRDEVEITFKVYSQDKQQALDERNRIYTMIVYPWREEFLSKGYGIVEHSKEGNNHQKLDSKPLYCYMFSITIDFNNTVERVIEKLTTVEITGDINITETI